MMDGQTIHIERLPNSYWTKATCPFDAALPLSRQSLGLGGLSAWIAAAPAHRHRSQSLGHGERQRLQRPEKRQSLAGDAFLTGMVLYDGHQALSFGDGLWAEPLEALNAEGRAFKLHIMTAPIFSAPTPDSAKLEVLRQHFPQAVEVDAQGRIRINATQLQMAVDPSNVQVEEDGFEMRWVGKREAYHSAFVKPNKILQPQPAQSKNWDSTSNLLIKGDNLDALRLLRQSYFGKVKLIYIDPPYNTQSDSFIYRDDFSASQAQVLEQLGYDRDNIDYIKNIYGARTHSGWLSFMFPRLLLARDLLRDDGVIFISIDDNEQAQLKLLCDEVFGQESFVCQIAREVIKGGSKSSHFREVTDSIICYAKDKTQFVAGGIEQLGIELNLQDENGPYAKGRELNKWGAASQRSDAPGMYFPIPGPNGEDVYPIRNDGTEGRWRYGRKSLLPMIARGDAIFEQRTDGTYTVYQKIRESNPRLKQFTTLFKDKYINAKGTERLKEIFATERAIFNFPKPVELIEDLLLASGVEADDIVLDFFAGSGTTADAVMSLNAKDGDERRFILVQIPQTIDAKKFKEAYEFVIKVLEKPTSIFEITAERIRRAGAKISADAPDLDVGFRVFELLDDPHALILQKPLHEATQADVLALQRTIGTTQPEQIVQVLYNLLLAEGLPLSTFITTVIEHHIYRAANVVLVLQAVALDTLTDTLQEMKASGTPATYLTVYAPWITDDNFMQGIKTLAESLGYSDEKLKLRG